MKTVKILDCTLRDGGFVNDFDFGIGSIKSIISRLIAARIDVVEIGWLDQRRENNSNHSILPSTKAYKPLIEGINREGTLIVGMIDYGTCSIEAIEPQSQSIFDGIRIIFKKKDADAALEFCKCVKDLGYKIFVQPVSITSYSDEEYRTLLKKIDLIKPYSVALVDTYGLMHREQLFHYFHIIDSCLNPEVRVGYHAHNNFQLAYSNGIELAGLASNRNLLIDSTLYGMGKGAGNANTELLAMNLNQNFSGNYDLDQILEAIDVDIMKEYIKRPWGYGLNYYLSAMNDCHPDYVKFLGGKRTLSVASINKILKNIPVETRLIFNKTIIEQLYDSFQANHLDDNSSYEILKQKLSGKDILVIAPGASVEKQNDEIKSFIESKKPVTISVNYLPLNIPVDYAFFSNGKRFSQYLHLIKKNRDSIKVIATSNVESIDGIIDYHFNLESIKNTDEYVGENPSVLLISILEKINTGNLILAGLDGYSGDNKSDYTTEHVPFLFCNENVLLRNEAMKKFLSSKRKNWQLTTLTESQYF